MNASQISQAADLLLRARRDKLQIAGLPAECRPASLDDGYAIQRELARRAGEAVVGWKVGMTSEIAQQRRGLNHPISGRVFTSDLYSSPAEPPVCPPMLCIEGELAFRLGRDLPARARSYTRHEIVDAIDVMYLALEICGSRFETWMDTDAAGVVADNGFNTGLVLGPAVSDWRSRRLADIAVRIVVEGALVDQGSGAQVMGGDPMMSILFLANQQSSAGEGLLAGQVVTTGTMHGAPVVSPRAHCVADFGELGQVCLRYRS
ncbi:MAG: 2-keto-4-pentenoate hydratase [Burkholderiaceae bacterium]